MNVGLQPGIGQFKSWSRARNHAAKRQFMTRRVNSSKPVKQKFSELLAALPITTVGRGLAPAGGRNSRICAALRRIRAMLRDFSSAPADQRRREQRKTPALRCIKKVRQFEKHRFAFLSIPWLEPIPQLIPHSSLVPKLSRCSSPGNPPLRPFLFPCFVVYWFRKKVLLWIIFN